MNWFLVTGGFILFDVLSGLLKAFYKGDLNSSRLREGLYHKASECLALIGSGLLNYGCRMVDLDIDLPLLPAVGAYICVMELVSILENIAEVNPNLAKLFKPYLAKLKDKE